MKRLQLGCVTVLLVIGVVCRPAAAQDDDRPAQPEKPSAQSDAPSSAPDSPTATPATTADQANTPDSPAVGAPAGGKAGGRMFGVLPNYTTVEGASTITPISSREKFNLVKMNLLDPYLYPFVGVVAAIERSYGSGAMAYAKQYTASFADNSLGNFMTTAILPSLLHQDPRYFQRGRGSALSRIGYSASRLVVGRGDSGRAQFNLSEVAGNAAAATMANAYYPMTERGVSETLSRWAMQLMWDGLSYQLKEFWPDVRRKITRHKVPVP